MIREMYFTTTNSHFAKIQIRWGEDARDTPRERERERELVSLWQAASSSSKDYDNGYRWSTRRRAQPFFWRELRRLYPLIGAQSVARYSARTGMSLISATPASPRSVRPPFSPSLCRKRAVVFILLDCTRAAAAVARLFGRLLVASPLAAHDCIAHRLHRRLHTRRTIARIA